MKILKLAATLCVMALAGCADLATGPTAPVAPVVTEDGPGARLGADRAAEQFAQVVDQMLPVIEQSCRRARSDRKCDYQIIVDTRLREPANAFQTLDDNGEPVLIFTIALIGDMRNPDELALVMSHEASHHILNHLAQQRTNADRGARVYAEAATLAGASQDDIARATEFGAALGARTYSKQFELEADSLGAQLARRAGFDPLNGALYFLRLPDPGDEFLSTHPSNAERMATVRKAARGS